MSSFIWENKNVFVAFQALSTTEIILNPYLVAYYVTLTSWEVNKFLNIKIYQCLVPNRTNMSNFIQLKLRITVA